MMVERLTRHGVPVTVHEAKLYLSIPLSAEIHAEGTVLRRQAAGLSVTAERARGRARLRPGDLSKSIGKLVRKNQARELSKPSAIDGKIVISEGFAFRKDPRVEQPAPSASSRSTRHRYPWGICTSIWARPISTICRASRVPVAAVNNPDGNASSPSPMRAGRISSSPPRGRLVHAEAAVVEIKGREGAGEIRAHRRALR